MTRALAWAALVCCAPLFAEEVEFTAADGTQLSGTLAVVERSAPTVICLPMYRSERSSYVPLSRALTARGINVFALDLRGHGKSSPQLAEKVEGRDPALFNAMHQDVAAALKAMQEKGLDTSRVALVGASVGCSVAIDASTRQPDAFQALVLLTPGANYLGVDSLAHAKRWKGLPTLILTSQEEAGGVRPVAKALQAKRPDVELRVIEDQKGIHGTRMFGEVPDVEADIAAFLAEHLLDE